MKNASVSDVLYELVWFMEQSLETDPDLWGQPVQDPDIGRNRLTWRAYGSTKWLSDPLEKLRIVEKIGPGYLVRVSCRDWASIDFSLFENHNCYVEAMHALESHPAWCGSKTLNELTAFDHRSFSPCFVSNVVRKDDVFSQNQEGAVLFDGNRFGDKVSKEWLRMTKVGNAGKAFCVQK